MIRIKNLCKHYKKGKRKNYILKDISFDLPDRGLVFIVGKSGSGKSTLLNVLGGLDSFDSGDIIIENKKMSEFKGKDFDSYRNTYLGFVFQEFNLINELNVYQNVEVALSIKGEDDENLIMTTLQKVGLYGYEKRYSNELSGGQRQRVAIARSLVKKPKVILADEPTGNLDSKTSIKILNLLKELSEKNLIIIVSHNLEDANKYADRIIELKDGHVVNYLQREEGYENKFKIVDGVVSLPYNKQLDDDELDELNKSVKNNEIKNFVQLSNGFKDCQEIPDDKNEVKFKKSSFKKKKLYKISTVFLKTRYPSYLLTILMISFLVVLFGLSQLFVNFDASETIDNMFTASINNSVVLEKGYHAGKNNQTVGSSYMLPIQQGDIESLVESGYTGNVYKLYNYSIPIGAGNNIVSQVKVGNETNFKTFYIKELYGTLLTDKDYLNRLFGYGGEVELLAGNLDEDKGIIITDYVADCILKYNSTKYNTYEDIIGDFTNVYGVKLGYIKAIIKTNYLEKYGSFKDKFFETINSPMPSKNLSSLIKSKEGKEYINEVRYYLGIAYTFDENYIDKLAAGGEKDVVFISKADIVLDNGSVFTRSSVAGWIDESADETLNDREIVMSVVNYNTTFGTTYTQDNYTSFVPHKVRIRQYPKYIDETTDPLYDIEVKIVRLDYNTKYSALYSKDVYEIMTRGELINYAVYLDEQEYVGELHDQIKSSAFFINTEGYIAVDSLVGIVGVFSEVFSIIIIFIMVACIVLVFNFANDTIKKNKFNIGVLRSLGARTKDILKIFSNHIILIGIFASLLSGVLLYFLTSFANLILIESFVDILGSELIRKLTILEFDKIILIFDLVLIVMITLITSLLPIVTLNKIKPINIIKDKE